MKVATINNFGDNMHVFVMQHFFKSMFFEQFLLFFSKLYLFLDFRTTTERKYIKKETGLTCNSKIAKIDCPEHSKIEIVYAKYGYWKETKCHTWWCGFTCEGSVDVKKFVSQRCNGKQNCEFKVHEKVFGHNPTKQYKYAEYTYRCYCENELYAGETCSQCANSKHDPDKGCKECIDTFSGYPACNTCLPNHYDYPACKGKS